MDIVKVLRNEFKRPEAVIEKVLGLFQEGGTVPFVARYRKEVTQNMDEVQLRSFEERLQYLVELEKRKETVLKTVREQGKLSSELEKRIKDCMDKVELEELYLPYKPKRKTRASQAKEKGLESLAVAVLEEQGDADPKDLAEKMMDRFKNVKTIEEALQGASDIIAEQFAETPELRDYVRHELETHGQFHSWVHPDFKDKHSKFEMYYDYRAPVKNIPSHNMLAIRRGEKEKVLQFTIEIDDAKVLDTLKQRVVKNPNTACGRLVVTALEDGYNRLMKSSLITMVRTLRKQTADDEAINNFAINLRNLLLLPPAGTVPVLAVDPGFRTGCKMTALSETGKFLEHATLYPNEPRNDTEGAAKIIVEFVEKYRTGLVAIGNGTASRETYRFVQGILSSEQGKALQEKLGQPVKAIIVNESGASVYSASKTAVEEFPKQDVTVRGAISIGRRLQDPLAEMVKIEPRSLGVGQYQHDVDQGRLRKRLGGVVESCVNQVGVDLNTASPHLLSYVAGLNTKTASSIVEYRNKNGTFANRHSLKHVPGLGEKAFEQSAGFLRIRAGENPLDNSAVHPERYGVVEMMAKALGSDVRALVGNPELVRKLNAQDFVDEESGVGLPTIRDILQELVRPGRDPRKEFKTASFKEDVKEIKDLQKGMVLEGNVTNVTNFGAFVDIGVHQEGLVHVSEVAHRFLKSPLEVLSVGLVVKVKVLDVDVEQSRISLSMKQALPAPIRRAQRPQRPESRQGPRQPRQGDRPSQRIQRRQRPQRSQPEKRPREKKPEPPREPREMPTIEDLLKLNKARLG